MGQVLHGCARTTEAVRRAIQNSKESIAKLAEHYNFNPKTIVKWKKRSFVTDAAMGPKQPRSTVLTQRAKRLKTLKGLTLYEFICDQWTKSSDLFILNLHHHTLGPYTQFNYKYLISPTT